MSLSFNQIRIYIVETFSFGNIGGAIGIVSVVYGINILLGLGRDVILAAMFGATKQLDAFLIGMSFVKTNGLLVGSAISSALIPIFIDILPQKREIVFSFIVRGLRDLFIVLIIISLGIITFSEPLAKALGPGLSSDGQLILTQTLQGLAPLFLILGLSGLTKTIADSTGRYISHPMLLVSMTAGLIGGVVTLQKKMGIQSAVIGLVGGAVIGLILQGIIIGWNRFSLSVTLRQLFWHKTIYQKRLSSALPYRSISILLVSSLAIQAQGIIEKRYVSYLPSGTIVSLSLALSLLAIPTTLLLPAITSVLLPHFVRQKYKANQSKYGLSLQQYSVLASIFVTFTVLYWVGGRWLVYTLFYRGAFSASAADLTAKLLRLLSISFTPYILTVIFRQVLLAKRMLAVDLAIITIVLFTKTLLLQISVPRYGINGVIGAIVFGSFLNAILYFGFIQYAPKKFVF